jgi:hypothetical protein
MNAVVNVGPIAISGASTQAQPPVCGPSPLFYLTSLSFSPSLAPSPAAAEPWQLYSSGVFSSKCGSDVDHAIVLVGYGTDATSGLDYYLIRNSWSAGWGEEGYIRVARYGEKPAGEPCFTDNTPGDGDGCSGGPSSIQVCGLCGVLSDSSYPVGAKLL